MVPEGRRIFARLTVAENLEMAPTPASADLNYLPTWSAFSHCSPRLKERRTQLGGTLSGGEQQMLATGRALMAHPACS